MQSLKKGKLWIQVNINIYRSTRIYFYYGLFREPLLTYDQSSTQKQYWLVNQNDQNKIMEVVISSHHKQ